MRICAFGAGNVSGGLVELNNLSFKNQSVQLVYSERFNDPETFYVNWKLGIFCNYSCSYCWVDSHSNRYDYKKLSQYIIMVDTLVDVALTNNFTKIQLNLLGGELTTYKQFYNFLKYIDQITDIHFTVVLQTNLSAPVKYFDKMLSLSRINFKIIGSYHHEFSNLDQFIDKIRFIKSKDINVLATVVMSPKNFDQLVDVAKKLNDSHDNNVFTIEYNDDKVVDGYTDLMYKDIQTLNSNNKDDHFVIVTDKQTFRYNNADIMLSEQSTNFSGWNCLAGQNSIIIDKNGVVKRCLSGIDKPLGNIRTGFKLTNDRCITSTCICAYDLNKRKWK